MASLARHRAYPGQQCSVVECCTRPRAHSCQDRCGLFSCTSCGTVPAECNRAGSGRFSHFLQPIAFEPTVLRCMKVSISWAGCCCSSIRIMHAPTFTTFRAHCLPSAPGDRPQELGGCLLREQKLQPLGVQCVEGLEHAALMHHRQVECPGQAREPGLRLTACNVTAQQPSVLVSCKSYHARYCCMAVRDVSMLHMTAMLDSQSRPC